MRLKGSETHIDTTLRKDLCFLDATFWGGAKEVERGRSECRRWKIISGRGWERAGEED